MRNGLIAGIFAFIAVAAPASAHHAAAIFDMSKQTTIAGTIKDYEWTNPHCWIFVKQPLPGGGEKTWLLVAGPPSILTRLGLNKSDLNVGDQITVHAHPETGGQAVASVIDLALANGKLVDLAIK